MNESKDSETWSLLAGKPVIPPTEEESYPAIESLRWREDRLTATY